MMVLNILCFLWANILFYPAMEMVPLCLGAVHVRGVMVGETRYAQAQSGQGTVFQGTMPGDPQLQWLENPKSSVTIHLF